MIRSNETEYVRVKLEPVRRDAAEVGTLLVAAIEKGEHLRREKARVMDEFRREEEALSAEIAGLVREQKGEPVKRHKDIACLVQYDMEHGDRVLIDHLYGKEMGRRPMTPQEREKAEALAKEQA